MYSVAIIGAGIVSQRHVLACAANPDTRLCAVVDLVEEKAKAAAEPYGAAVYTDYMAMLDQQKPDAVVINLPHGLHESCAVACAERGIHVLLEKPMSVSWESCQRINAAFAKSGALLQIGHPQRYLAHNIIARRIIESGELGDIVLINEVRAVNYFVPNRPRWFLKKELAGGGIWMNFGAHSLDKLCFLTGSSIQSVTGKCTYENKDVDVDGSAQVLAHMENGVTAAISIVGYNVKPREESLIYLTKGSLCIARGKVVVTKDGVDEEPSLEGCPAPFQAQFDDFVQGIKDGKILCNDGYYGAEIIRHVESVWKNN